MNNLEVKQVNIADVRAADERFLEFIGSAALEHSKQLAHAVSRRDVRGIVIGSLRFQCQVLDGVQEHLMPAQPSFRLLMGYGGSLAHMSLRTMLRLMVRQ